MINARSANFKHKMAIHSMGLTSLVHWMRPVLLVLCFQNFKTKGASCKTEGRELVVSFGSYSHNLWTRAHNGIQILLACKAIDVPNSAKHTVPSASVMSITGAGGAVKQQLDLVLAGGLPAILAVIYYAESGRKCLCRVI